ncbi:condensation domain-containing protein [Salinispora arenicola]|uniref:condensation domain-containing protein n=1 Tax=Salinispora arenicola TaxID=168697 RepID=UPI0027DABDF4|nr:condensation domain-containing protein [Salinispora arenicola]
MQEALWWVHQRARDQSVYHLTWRLGVNEPIDGEALAVAWQALVDRHEALRTSVVRQAGTVTLVVAPRIVVSPHRLHVDDLEDADTHSAAAHRRKRCTPRHWSRSRRRLLASPWSGSATNTRCC